MLFRPVYFGEAEFLSQKFPFNMASQIPDYLKRALILIKISLKFSFSRMLQHRTHADWRSTSIKVLYFLDNYDSFSIFATGINTIEFYNRKRHSEFFVLFIFYYFLMEYVRISTFPPICAQTKTS